MAVLISSLIALLQKRLTHEQFGLDKKFMSWCAHWGNWSNLLLMGFILALIWPQRHGWNSHIIWVGFSISALLTLICHMAWSLNQLAPGHIIKGEKTTFDLDLTIGGYYHVAYMFTVLGIIICFFLKNLNNPSPVYLKVSILFSLFVSIAIIQPTLYCNRFEDIKTERDRKVMGALILTGSTLLVIWSPYLITFTNTP